jgi:hypothetical protein
MGRGAQSFSAPLTREATRRRLAMVVLDSSAASYTEAQVPGCPDPRIKRKNSTPLIKPGVDLRGVLVGEQLAGQGQG